MKVRDVKWDNYKALLAFLMVFGHTFRAVIGNYYRLGGVFIFIYLFHMPAFLFVSGMFSKKAVERNDTRRPVSLFLQYLLVKGVLWAVSCAIDMEMKAISLLTETGVAWFALSVMECTLLTMLLKNINRRYVFTISVILGCAVGFCSDIGGFLSLSRTIVYYPYFYLGYCLKSSDLEKTADRRYVKAGSLAFFAVLLVICVLNAKTFYPFREFIKAKASYFQYADILGHISLGAVYRLILYIVGFAMIFACFFMMPKRKIPVISGVGSRTLAIYVFHFALLNVLSIGGWLKNLALSLCSSTLQIALFYVVVCSLMTFVSSLPFLEKFCRWVTAVPADPKTRETGSNP